MAEEKYDEIEEFDDEESHDHVEDESDETSDEVKDEMNSGRADQDVYTEEGREKLLEDDELEPDEEGFMEGAEDRGEQTSCAYCGKMISEDKGNIYEREFDGEIKLFCSEEHAEAYAKKHKR